MERDYNAGYQAGLRDGICDGFAIGAIGMFIILALLGYAFFS